MSREFTLVLLGSGALAAGYAAAPSGDEVVQQQEDVATATQTGQPAGTHSSHRHGGGGMFLFVHSSGYAGYSTPPGRSAASPAVSRGGFGGAGRAAGAGGAAS